MNCPTCHTPNDRTARSCSTCGTSLDKSAPASSQTGATADPNRRMTIAERRAAGITTSGPGSTATTQTVTHDRDERQWQPAMQSSDRLNPFALVSMILGILGGTILAIIFGHLAKAQIRRTGERGSGMATAGLVLGYLWTTLLVIYFIWMFVLFSSMRVNY